ncbi:hypothetical protein [Candidatus Deianiraea vastatrix]|uniref:Uncharacterized protein n=1 Tax=Candidatus Deianiraea vastatrix TaxID=2163644 RepID=A0A5B8XEQ5_9RICK|nr:hypothetical protein [Candidatus Deianiraea vastatrix]QED23743.1 hypothetical protein Deia_00956 [Candidatus Deianiraea vastatrix]
MRKIIHSCESEYYFVRNVIWLFFALNFLVWFFLTKNIKPDLTITPVPPGKHLMKFFSMGDDSFIYRHFGYKIQMAGDDYGTTTPLKDYNYAKLQKWFLLLNEFDPISEYIPSLAGLYYSNSQNPLDNIYIVDYLISFAKRDPSRYWRWLTTASYLSAIKLKDMTRVEEASKLLLTTNEKVPLWAKTVGIFMMTKKDLCSSLNLIASLEQEQFELLATDKVFSGKSPEENIFVQIILNRITEIKKNPQAAQKCKVSKYKIDKYKEFIPTKKDGK